MTNKEDEKTKTWANKQRASKDEREKQKTKGMARAEDIKRGRRLLLEIPKDEGRKQGEKQKPEAIARAERSYKFIE